MANIILDWGNWEDNYGNVIGNESDRVIYTNGIVVAKYVGSVNPGDSVAGNIELHTTSEVDVVLEFYRIPGGGETAEVLWSEEFTGSMQTSIDITLASGGGYDYGFRLMYVGDGGHVEEYSELWITPGDDPPDPPVPPPQGCEELGRVTRAFVSGYDRARVHVGTVRRHERRCLVADYNGAIPAGRTIAATEWRCTTPWVAKMSSPTISDRQAQVMVDFQFGGFSAIRCTATLDNGEVYSQVFEFQVRDAPGFFENAPISAGPFVLRVAAD